MPDFYCCSLGIKLCFLKTDFPIYNLEMFRSVHLSNPGRRKVMNPCENLESWVRLYLIFCLRGPVKGTRISTHGPLYTYPIGQVGTR